MTSVFDMNAGQLSDPQVPGQPWRGCCPSCKFCSEGRAGSRPSVELITQSTVLIRILQLNQTFQKARDEPECARGCSQLESKHSGDCI